jgi:Family of unknown function (DUF5681)
MRSGDAGTRGIRKTAEAGRLQKGRSGNPEGRPKKAKSFRTIVHQQLETPVEVRINGRVKKISKREAIISQMVNKAATGDSRSAELLLLKLALLQRDWQAVDHRAVDYHSPIGPSPQIRYRQAKVKRRT